MNELSKDCSLDCWEKASNCSRIGQDEKSIKVTSEFMEEQRTGWMEKRFMAACTTGSMCQYTQDLLCVCL